MGRRHHLNSFYFYCGVFIFGVLVSSFAQIALKKTAVKEHESLIKEYLNAPVICAYAVFFAATFCSVYAYKGIPLHLGPILESTQYLFVAVLSYILLKEKLTKRRVLGIVVILCGVLICSL